MTFPMIKKYNQFINESFQRQDFLDKVEDVFIDILDDYGLDVQVTEGFFINDQWVVGKMVKDVIDMLKGKGMEYNLHKSFQVILATSYTLNHQELEDLQHFTDEKIEKLNIDLRRSVDRFSKMYPEYEAKYIPTVTKKAWTITFWFVKKDPIVVS
jgi:hypothetical protein